MGLIDEGLIDATLGGPPCSTVARSRHVYMRGGPRPVRFRHCVWDRPHLSWHEKRRVDESNTLWLNYMATCEGVSSRGGVHLWEHPADPGIPPYPSIWCTEEMKNMEERTGAIRAILHQCPFGGIAPKLTCLSGTVDGLVELDGIRCPGLSQTHSHGVSIGRAPDGSFYTRRLQTYPVRLCAALADLFVTASQRMTDTNTGPTGAIRVPGQLQAPRITHWSTWACQHRYGVVMLNEAAVRQRSLVVNSLQSAAYVHVDDTVFVSGCRGWPAT